MKFDAERVKRVYTTPPGGYAPPPPAGTLRHYLLQASFKLQDRFFDNTKLREEAFAACKLATNSSVLLLCCGSARDLPYITKYTGPHARVVGIDFSAAMLESGRAFVSEQGATNVDLREGDVTGDLMLGDATFDVVCCAFGLSVIPNWEGAYANLVKHAKIGGRILVLDARRAGGWRALFNPAFVWSVRKYGGTREGNRNFMRVVDRMKRELADVAVGLQHFAGYVCGTRAR